MFLFNCKKVKNKEEHENKCQTRVEYSCNAQTSRKLPSGVIVKLHLNECQKQLNILTFLFNSWIMKKDTTNRAL